MTPTDAFDRDLERWLTERAVPIEPAGAHEAAIRMARRSRQRQAWLVALGGRSYGGSISRERPATVRLSLLLAAGLLIALLAGAIALSGSRPALVVATPSDPVPSSVASESPSLPAAATSLVMRSAHVNPTVAALPDGRVLVIGSCYNHGTAAEVWDPRQGDDGQGRFLYAGDVLDDMCLSTATVLQDGRVFVSNGTDVTGTGVPVEAEIWDPVTMTFSRAGRPAGFHRSQRATLQPDGSVLVAGFSGGDDPGNVTAERWDPATMQFRHVDYPRPTHWYGHYAAVLPDGRELHLDQIDSNGYPAGVVAKVWDPVAGTDLTTGPMRSPRVGATLTVLTDGRVLVAGGYEPKGDGSQLPVTTVEIWDPATGSFSVTTPLLVARTSHAAVLLDEHHVFLAGDDRYSNGPDSAEIYVAP